MVKSGHGFSSWKKMNKARQNLWKLPSPYKKKSGNCTKDYSSCAIEETQKTCFAAAPNQIHMHDKPTEAVCSHGVPEYRPITKNTITRWEGLALLSAQCTVPEGREVSCTRARIFA